MLVLQGVGIMILWIGVVFGSVAIVEKSKEMFKFITLPLLISSVLIITGSETSKDNPEEIPILAYLGIIMLILWIIIFIYFLIKSSKLSDEEINQSDENQETFLEKAVRYCNDRDKILNENKNIAKYSVLEKAFDELPVAYYGYLNEILGVKKISKSTMSPIVATAIGNSIGGVSGGIAFGLSAYEKKMKREEEIKEFDYKYRSIQNKKERIIFLENTIEDIIIDAAVENLKNKKV